MELKQFIRLLWRWSWLIVVLIAIAGAAAYIVSKRTVPVYEASTTLLINQMPANGAAVDLNALRTSEELAGTYVALLRKRPVMEAVIANFALDTDPDQLAKRVKVSLIRDTQLIVVTVEDTDPQRAADIADEVVRVFSQQNRELQASRYAASKQNLQQELLRVQADIENIQTKLDALASVPTLEKKVQKDQLELLMEQSRSSYTTLLKSYEQVRVSAAQTIDNLNVVEPALPDTAPTRPKTMLNILLAILVAVMIGVGLVYLFGYLDDSVKSNEELERLMGVPTLAAIARIGGGDFPDKLIVATNRQSPIAEAYRMLRTNIDFATIDNPLRTVVITSSRPGEGKSVTVANLGAALAQTGKRVILVDADLRRPTLHKYFSQTNMRGVTTALLRHEGTIKDHLVPSGVDNLLLMPSGPLPPNPAELVGSQRMAALIEELTTHADIILFDTPPLLAVVDSALLAHVCDATLLVALAGVTRADALRSSKDHLFQSGARLLGTVFNQVSAATGGYYQTYYSHHTSNKGRVWWLLARLPWRRNGSAPRTAESLGRRAIAAGSPEQPSKGRVWWLPARLPWRRNGSAPRTAESIVRRAIVEELLDQPLYNGHNGSHSDMAEVSPDQALHNGNNGNKHATLELPALVEGSPDQALHNGNNDDQAKSLALHMVVEGKPDQRQTESAGEVDQKTPAADEVTIITPSEVASSARANKRATRSGPQNGRAARKLPKPTS